MEPSEPQAITPQKKPPSLKANFIFNILIQVSTYVISLVTSPYLSRVFGATGVGDYAYAFSFVNYFMIVVAFGFRNYGTRQIATERDDPKAFSKTFWEIFFARFLLFSLAFTTYFTMAYFGGFGDKVNRTVALILSANIVSSFIDTTFFFQAKENFKTLSIFTLVFKTLYVVGIFLFIKTPNDLPLYAVLTAGYLLLTMVTQLAFVLPKIKRPCFREMQMGKCFKQGFLYFLPTIAITIYTAVDKTMLGIIKDTVEVGYYEQSHKIVFMVISFLFALGTAVMPRISYLYSKGDKEGIASKFSKMAKVYALFAFPAAAGLYAIAPYFIPAFFGEEFAPSINVMYAMIPLILFMPLSNYVDSGYYVPSGNVKKATIFYYAAAIINFLLNLLTINLWGAIGAAISSWVSEVTLFTLFVIFSRKEVDYPPLLKPLLKPLIAALIMFAVLFVGNLFLVPKLNLGDVPVTIIEIAVGASLYALALLVLRDEMLMSIIKRVASKFRHHKSTSETGQ